MASFKFNDVAGADYDETTSNELRDELIKIRDKSLFAGDFESTIVLSHTIAWMHRAIEALTKEG